MLIFAGEYVLDVVIRQTELVRSVTFSRFFSASTLLFVRPVSHRRQSAFVER